MKLRLELCVSFFLLWPRGCLGERHRRDRHEEWRPPDRRVKESESGRAVYSMKYLLGTSDVQWSQVDHIESNQLFLVKTEGGVVYTGTLSTADVEKGRPMTIEVVDASARKVNLERAKVIQMDTTSEHFWQRFNGSINSGISYSKGNQSTRT